MNRSERRLHWENVYETKAVRDLSWYQPVPEASLRLIAAAGIDHPAPVIDIGGGDSFLTENLLQQGFTDLQVLDISAASLARAKARLGAAAECVTWIQSDITAFTPSKRYDCWHDRAVFHFITEPDEISTYVRTAGEAVTPGGALIIGTFSDHGPLKCSGIDVRRYNEDELAAAFICDFRLIETFREDHPTPFGTTQNFVFARFERKN